MYNGWMLAHARLVELAKYLPYEEAEVLLVDNCSDDYDIPIGINFWKKAFPAQKNFRYLPLDQNYGFGIGNNKGVEQAEGKYLILLNTDVIIRKPFIDEILPMLASDDQIMLGGRLVNWDGGWNTFEIRGKKYTVPYCEGWALALSHAAWDSLGGFDPIYAPYDCEDLDLSMNALAHGFHLSSMPSDLFTHMGSKTFQINLISGDERRKVTEINRAKFFEKWKDEIPKWINSKS